MAEQFHSPAKQQAPAHELPADDHIRIQTCKGSADLTHITGLLEKGSTAALESVFSCPQTAEERMKTLQTIQHINGVNIDRAAAKGDPAVTKLQASSGSDWPFSWGTYVDVRATPPGKPEREIYSEVDYKEGGHRVVEHHPDFFKKSEK